MKLLLTSNGVTNASIRSALDNLLGRPVEDSRALFVVTGMHPFANGGEGAMRALRGDLSLALVGLGWKSLGLLELTALESVSASEWQRALDECDALLVWGGHVSYLHYWMRRSGLLEFVAPRDDLVYVGVSAGSIVMGSRNCDAEFNRAVLAPGAPASEDAENGLGIVDFSLWVHVGNPNPIFADHTPNRVREWAQRENVATYSLDDASAVVVDGERCEVVSEGQWAFYSPQENTQ